MVACMSTRLWRWMAAVARLWRADGASVEVIARRLAVSPDTVRRLLEEPKL
jgi:DeoR/GlpR family transcriptional regulator of sugar metabolism